MKEISLSTPLTNILLQLCLGLNAFLNRDFCASSPSDLVLTPGTQFHPTNAVLIHLTLLLLLNKGGIILGLSRGGE